MSTPSHLPTQKTPPAPNAPLRSGVLYTLARHGQGLSPEAAAKKVDASLCALRLWPDHSPEAA